MLVRLRVFQLTAGVIDRWVVGVTADISSGALLRKSKPVDIDGWPAGRAARLGVIDGLLIIVSEAARWRKRRLLTSCWRLVAEPL